MKSALILTAPLALAIVGCAGRSEGGIARVPIPVRCVTQDQIPAVTPPAGALPDDARQSADLLGAVLRDVRNEARELRALLVACTR